MRNCKIDLLRFIGLSMIIFAHVGSHGFLFQLRNFDVPLMVLISGMSFGLSYKEDEKYSFYIWKRIKRLVFPVWIFLTLYFSVTYLCFPNSIELSLKVIATSYLLVSGIGYVWIIKVFLLVALISPFIFNFHKRTHEHGLYFLILAMILLAYEILRYFTLPYIDDGLGKAVAIITHYIIPYGVIFALGLRMVDLTNKQLSYLSWVCLLLFMTIGFALYIILGRFEETQNYKYPPSVYYLSYAIFVSTFIWSYSGWIEKIAERLKILDLILFCAQNSIWIYLWHIPLIKLFSYHYMINFFIVFSVSSFITLLQVTVVKKGMDAISNQRIKKNLKVLLTG